MLLGMEIQIITDRRVERIEGRFTRKSLPNEFQVLDGVSLTGYRQSNHIAYSDESGHLFQSISDTIPGLSDSCRSEATRCGSDNGVSDRSQGLVTVFALPRSPAEGRRSVRPTQGVVAPSIRAGGERRERTPELQFAFPPVATRNGFTRPSE